MITPGDVITVLKNPARRPRQIKKSGPAKEVRQLLRETDFKPAENRAELEEAYFLAYHEYLKRGYTRRHPSKLKISIYNALPQTATFIAKTRERVISTVTLIVDSSLGLPMDEIYKEELDGLRRKGRKLAEVSMLASDTGMFGKGISLMLNSGKLLLIFNLFKLLFDYAREAAGVQDLCIAIHPKHNITYRYLLFKELGGLKHYRVANGNPAIAKRVDLTTIEDECKERKGLYRMFLARKTEMDKFNRKITLSPSDLKYFFVQKTDIFKKATEEQLNYLKQCYPSYDLASILNGK